MSVCSSRDARLVDPTRGKSQNITDRRRLLAAIAALEDWRNIVSGYLDETATAVTALGGLRRSCCPGKQLIFMA